MTEEIKDTGKIEEELSDVEAAADEAATQPSKEASKKTSGQRGKHAQDIPEYEKTAKSLRKNLIIAIVVLVLVVALILAGIYFFLTKSQEHSESQSVEQATEIVQISGNENNETESTDREVAVPNLHGALAKNYDEALATIAHGAQATSDESRDEDDEDNPIKRVVKLALNEDASDSKTSAPSVTLNFNNDDVVSSLSYQTSTKVLGYGSMSFHDAVVNDKIVGSSLQEAGISVSDDEIKLPEDASMYSTYTSSGAVSKEEQEWSGSNDDCTWTAKLIYDYTLSLTTQKIDDTVRTISITVSFKSEE